MENLLRVAEVARLLNVSREAVLEWMSDGLIEYISLPKTKGGMDNYRISSSSVQTFIETHTIKKTDESEQQQ